MAIPTYSINVGTPQEANTSPDITSVLNQLPDNTQMLITPEDVRDAAFSNWENSVIRWTADSFSNNYIGFGRPEVQVPLYLGKQQYAGMYIMSPSASSLLSSETDIYFYNMKLDTAPTQDLVISLLGGSDYTLWPTAPYITVKEISETSSNCLSLSFVNPDSPALLNGNINIVAGTYGQLGLNNLIFPSTEQILNMIATPSTALSSDLYLVVRSGNYIELAEYVANVGNSLGTTGSITNIYGSIVNLNGTPLTFTNLTPTVTATGGIPIGATFSNVALSQMINQIIYPYLPPVVSVVINSSVIQERNHTSGASINYTYTLTKTSNNITSSQINVISVSGSPISSVAGATLSGIGLVQQSYPSIFNFSGANISANLNYGTFTFSVVATDGTQSGTASAGMNFVYPYFYGFSATSSYSAGSLTKLIDIFENQTVALTGTGYLFFSYPYLYGPLDEIYDGNNFLIYQSGTASNTWTYSVVSISSPSGYWGSTSYYVYNTINSVNIPLPSQNYKFDF